MRVDITFFMPMIDRMSFDLNILDLILEPAG